MLNHALAEVLRNPDEATRQSILDSYEPLTHRDPSEIGDVNTWLERAALSRPPIFGIPSPSAPASEASTAAAEEGETAATAEAADAASPLWKLPWSSRGFAIHKALGGNLPWWFKGIDDFTDGVATSFKTIDLDAATYQSPSQLSYRVNSYVDKLLAFNGKSYTGYEVLEEKITSRVLNLVVPKGSMTSVQKAVIDSAIERAKSLGIGFTVTPF
jgi:hypothetical protein